MAWPLQFQTGVTGWERQKAFVGYHYFSSVF
jgi:hypothetical protein